MKLIKSAYKGTTSKDPYVYHILPAWKYEILLTPTLQYI
jgi:hypothetical protein